MDGSGEYCKVYLNIAKMKTTMDWPWCCFRREPAYKQVGTDDDVEEVGPARYISARLDSEYDVENFRLKNTVSSLYRRVSEWSLPKKQQEKHNLFTVNEEEHDFLMDEPEPEAAEPLRPRHTVSSIYSKVSDWSFPKKTGVKLDTVKEEQHDCLMDEYTPMPSPPPMYEGRSPSPSSFSSPSSSPSPQTDIFDDVVDEMV